MKDYSVGPLALVKATAVNGLASVHHVNGLPSHWDTKIHPVDGSTQLIPNYEQRVHTLLIPETELLVRQHATGSMYLMYPVRFNDPNWNRQTHPGHYGIIRCDGGIASLGVTLSKPLAEPVTVHLSCRENPLIIPANTVHVNVALTGCAMAINANDPVFIKKIDSEDIVDLSIFTLSVDIKERGRLVTGQNIIPNWSI